MISVFTSVFGTTVFPAGDGVIGTEVVAGLRSGRGISVTLCGAGFRSGSETVPVTVVTSTGVVGTGPDELSGAAGVSCAAAGEGEASGAGVASATGAAARSGLRSGSDGAASALTTAGRVGFAPVAARRKGFASALAAAIHATDTSNGKMCARMRFISSIGYRLRSCVWQSGRPPSRGAATMTAL
jgi:hypothetical protein